MHKILIIEDDPVIQQAVQQALKQWQYEVVPVTDFNGVMETFQAEDPQLIIMDITLPFFNGYYWCQEIRKISKVPILFLSSHDQPVDIVMSINMGADDYITKPFEMAILVAKVQGLLRRTYEFTTAVDRLDYRGATLHLKAAQFTYQGEQVDLTKNEYHILRVLFERVGSYVSREELMRQLWNSEFYIDDNTLTVNVARLRKKLEAVGLKNFIVTKKGMGYGLVDSL